MLSASSATAPDRHAAPDRRAALKARHRAAILRAARGLVDERSGPRFSVDELAERADIARRTIFNHFASLDEILLTLCAEELDVIVDDFIAAVAAAPVGDDSRASMFDELAVVLRTTDLPLAIDRIGQILGEPDPDDARGRALSDEAFSRAATRLLGEVNRRHPGADALEAELLVSSLMGGVIVIAKHWILHCGVALDAQGRGAWSDLLERLIDSVRAGYRPRD
ncbi:TetR/AcrR family transcriptional regulator [Frondihabitans australicus]|uniref:TetR family transcriptional regulator n=1 Tax=Frondihabitans australicus TaxID=386892 RepID=A0A495IG69_9MICO|nr:TetR/AcrR family transcriptional regulator [Frondihabitans australicus]RKR74934.1 TetR family transcriptional regulator [Frondihabitans australicus]